jgi:hypothetical protein
MLRRLGSVQKDLGSRALNPLIWGCGNCVSRRFEADASTAEKDASGAAGGLQAADQTKPAEQKKRKFLVISNTGKALYFHGPNRIASWQWFVTDFSYWFWLALFFFVGAPAIYRIKVARAATTEQARLGETLLDQRTRDLLGDIELLRKSDPLRLESEANAYHDAFWKRRARAVSVTQENRRSIEMTRGMMQGEARGTDMTEWLGAKAKDDSEREIARRTHDYIQGFHQHLKSKRLI